MDILYNTQPTGQYSPDFLQAKQDAIRNSLGKDEQIYFPSPAAKIIALESKVNEEQAPIVLHKRKARRINEEKAAKVAAKEKDDKAVLAFNKQQREYKKLLEKAKARKPAARVDTVKSNTGHLKDTVNARRFMPQVGPPNHEGKIRVQVDAKTWLMVSPEKNVDEVVAKYLQRQVDKELQETKFLKY